MRSILRLFLPTLILFLLCGCSQPAVAVPETTENTVSVFPAQQRLKITATVEEGLGFTTIPAEDLGSNLTEDLTYLDLKDVTVEINGIQHPLETALREGLITVEEIFAYARLDARSGICGEVYESNHGLTHFTYCYPEFYLHLVYDIMVSPDGSSHLISDICLYQPGSNISYFYVDEKTGIPLTREDWGITFEVAEVTPTGITLNCTQSAGQQIGELVAEYYSLSTENYASSVPELPGVASTGQDAPLFTVAQNTNSQYTIDWSATYGALPQGSYHMTLYIRDHFDAQQVHPLMEDFSDRQYFDIPFTIF